MSKVPASTLVTLGNPIVVASDIAVCDGCGAEYHVVSDGYRAYALLCTNVSVDIETFAQSTTDKTQIEADCPLPFRGGPDACHGRVSLDFTDGIVWRAATSDAINLLAHGDIIERD